MARATRRALLALPIVSGGLVLSPNACTSQTAIVLVAPDDGSLSGDGTVASPDGGEVRPASSDGGDRAPVGADSADGGADLPDGRASADMNVFPDLAARDLLPEARDSGPVVLFSDDFAGGYEVNWLLSESSDGPVSDTFDGSNPIVTLDSTQDDFTRLRCNLDGSKFTNTTLTASMRLRVETAPASTRTVRLDVRQAAATANIFYAVGAMVATDGTITQVGIYKKVPDGFGDYTICQLAEGPVFATPIAMYQWKHIKLSISGTSSVHLTAFFEDLQVATYTDDCTSALTATNGAMVANGGCLADQTGLGIQVEKGLEASVDDVLVTAP